MATSPLGGFANLSRYQQAAVQPQANIMDQFVQALNQGISLAQLPQTLQAEAQQRQQQSILNAIRVATAQKQFEELNKTPEQRLAERFQENLIAQSYDPLSGVGRAVPGFEGQIIATPGAITPEQQNLLALRDAGVQAGGIPLEFPTAPLGTPIAPVLTPRGVPTGFSIDAGIPARVAEQARAARFADLEATEAAKAAGKLPSELAQIEAKREVKGAVEQPLRFETIGNTVLSFHPISGKEVNRTVIPAGKVARNTVRGLWIGNPNEDPNDPNFGQIARGTEPLKSSESKPAKPLPKSISERFSDATSAVDNLIKLKSYLDHPDVKAISGPIVGTALRNFPYNETAQGFEGIRGLTKQIIGKYLEGGVLRFEDEKKYEKIIPGLNMLPNVQQKQATELYGSLRKKLLRDMESYSKSGYDISNFEDSIAQLDDAFKNPAIVPSSQQPNVVEPSPNNGKVSSGNTFKLLTPNQ